MILISVLKINFLLAFEALVLIAAVFLLLHIKKQELSKWFTWSAYALILFVFSLMICTTVNGLCCYGDDDDCRKGKRKEVIIERGMGMGHHGMMRMKTRGCGMGPDCCMQEMNRGCKNKGACCMNKEDMDCCMEGEEEGCEEKSGADCCKKEEKIKKVIKDTVVIKK